LGIVFILGTGPVSAGTLGKCDGDGWHRYAVDVGAETVLNVKEEKCWKLGKTWTNKKCYSRNNNYFKKFDYYLSHCEGPQMTPEREQELSDAAALDRAQMKAKRLFGSNQPGSVTGLNPCRHAANTGEYIACQRNYMSPEYEETIADATKDIIIGTKKFVVGTLEWSAFTQLKPFILAANTKYAPECDRLLQLSLNPIKVEDSFPSVVSIPLVGTSLGAISLLGGIAAQQCYFAHEYIGCMGSKYETDSGVIKMLSVVNTNHTYTKCSMLAATKLPEFNDKFNNCIEMISVGKNRSDRTVACHAAMSQLADTANRLTPVDVPFVADVAISVNNDLSGVKYCKKFPTRCKGVYFNYATEDEEKTGEAVLFV